MHLLKAGVFFIAGFIAQLIFIITGLFVCMLPKSKDLSKCVPFTVPSNIGSWLPVHLPTSVWLIGRFIWLFDNDRDGARGDHRGWYWLEYFTPIVISLPVKIQVWLAGKGIVSPSFTFDLPKYLPDAFKYYWWLAIRNPANNFKRYVLGFDIRTATIETIYGADYVRDDLESTGWQLVRANNRYHFYLVRSWGKSNRAIVIELGNKFQIRHNGVQYESEHKYFKGFTFEINPYKDIS